MDSAFGVCCQQKIALALGRSFFFDHLGPAVFSAGNGIDVRPHLHIGLATVTYVFAGEILHRDNLGHVQPIRPNEINWMTAGKGIVWWNLVSSRKGLIEQAKQDWLDGSFPKVPGETEAIPLPD